MNECILCSITVDAGVGTLLTVHFATANVDDRKHPKYRNQRFQTMGMGENR